MGNEGCTSEITAGVIDFSMDSERPQDNGPNLTPRTVFLKVHMCSEMPHWSYNSADPSYP